MSFMDKGLVTLNKVFKSKDKSNEKKVQIKALKKYGDGNKLILHEVKKVNEKKNDRS